MLRPLRASLTLTPLLVSLFVACSSTDSGFGTGTGTAAGTDAGGAGGSVGLPGGCQSDAECGRLHCVPSSSGNRCACTSDADCDGTKCQFTTDSGRQCWTDLPTGGAGGAGSSGGSAAGGSGQVTIDCGLLVGATKVSTGAGDQYPDTALPKGACVAPKQCSMVVAHVCDCGGYGAVSTYSCSCPSSQWECTVEQQGDASCACSLVDAGTD